MSIKLICATKRHFSNAFNDKGHTEKTRIMSFWKRLTLCNKNFIYKKKFLMRRHAGGKKHCKDRMQLLFFVAELFFFIYQFKINCFNSFLNIFVHFALLIFTIFFNCVSIQFSTTIMFSYNKKEMLSYFCI